MASISRYRRAAFAGDLLTIVFVAFSAALGIGAAPASAATHTVVIKQYAYTPAALTVAQGDTVTWTNADQASHDITLTHGPAALHSPMLATGQSWSHTFTVAGSYSYLCSVHPDMVASVMVLPRPAVAPVHAVTAGAGHTAVRATTPVVAAARPATSGRSSVVTPVTTSATAPDAAPETAVTTDTGATLDPLILVAGTSTAVMVFCLLLLSSRPALPPDTQQAAPLDEPTVT